MATHSSILAWRIPWTKDLVGSSPWGCKESDTTERLSMQPLIPNCQVKLKETCAFERIYFVANGLG